MQGHVSQCGLHSPRVVRTQATTPHPTRDSDGRQLFEYLGRSDGAAADVQTKETPTPMQTEGRCSAEYKPHTSNGASCHTSAHSRSSSRLTTTTGGSTASPSPIAPPSYSTSAIDASMWAFPHHPATVPSTSALGGKPIWRDEGDSQQGSSDMRSIRVQADGERTDRSTDAVSRRRRCSFSSLLQIPHMQTRTNTWPSEPTTRHAGTSCMGRRSQSNITNGVEGSLSDTDATKDIPAPGRSLTAGGSLGTTASHGVSLSADAVDRSELSYTGAVIGHAGAAFSVELAAMLSIPVVTVGGEPLPASPHSGTRRPGQSPQPAEDTSVARSATASGPSWPMVYGTSDTRGDNSSFGGPTRSDEARALFASATDEEDARAGCSDFRTESPVFSPHCRGHEPSLLLASPPRARKMVPLVSPSLNDDDVYHGRDAEHCVTVHELPGCSGPGASYPTRLEQGHTPHTPAHDAADVVRVAPDSHTQSVVNAIPAPHNAGHTCAPHPDAGLVYSNHSHALALPAQPSDGAASRTMHMDDERPHTPSPPPRLHESSWSPSPLQQRCGRRLSRQCPQSSMVHSGVTSAMCGSPDSLQRPHTRRASCAADGVALLCAPEHPLAHRVLSRFSPARTTAAPARLPGVAHTPLVYSVASVASDSRVMWEASCESRATTAVASSSSSALPTPLRCDLYRGSSCPLKPTPVAAARASLVHEGFSAVQTPCKAGADVFCAQPYRGCYSPGDEAVHAFTGFPTPIKFSPIPTKVYPPVMHTPTSSSAASLRPQALLNDSPGDVYTDGARARIADTASYLTEAPASSSAAGDRTMRPTSAVTLFGPCSVSSEQTSGRTTHASPSSSSLLPTSSLLLAEESGAPRVVSGVRGRDAECVNQLEVLGQTHRESPSFSSFLTPIHASLTMTHAFCRSNDTFRDTAVSSPVPSGSALASCPTTHGPPSAPSQEPLIQIHVPGMLKMSHTPPLPSAQTSPTQKPAARVLGAEPASNLASQPRLQEEQQRTSDCRPPVVKLIRLSPSVIDPAPTPSSVFSVRSLVESASYERRQFRASTTAACTPRAAPLCDGVLFQTERLRRSTAVPHTVQKTSTVPVPTYIDAYGTAAYRSATAAINSWL